MARGLIVGGLAALALAVAPGLASAQTSPPFGAPRPIVQPIRPFLVYGVRTREQRSALVAQGFDIGERAWASHVELFGNYRQALALSVSGYRVIPETPDDFPPPDSDYHNYAETVADLQAMAAAHPNLVHLFSLGTSFEGRDLIGARVSNDATDNLSEPGVFYVGQHHAREHMTVEVVLSLLHMFVERPQITDLVNTHQIYLIPSLNPDGSEYDIQGGSYHYWRKNRQPPNGTDQNRNYSYRWGCCGGSSSDPYSEVYRGPNPFSTPEDQRMADFMLTHPNVTTGISYHSYGDLILYPYGYTYEDIPADMDPVDHATFVAMGARMQATTGYTAQQSSDLYITDGDWNDWMYGELHRYPITIELDGYGYGFYPPDDYIPQETRRNWLAAIFVAQISDCPRRIVGATCSSAR